MYIQKQEDKSFSLLGEFPPVLSNFGGCISFGVAQCKRSLFLPGLHKAIIKMAGEIVRSKYTLFWTYVDLHGNIKVDTPVVILQFLVVSVTFDVLWGHRTRQV